MTQSELDFTGSKRRVHPNSVASYYESLPALGKRAEEVLECYRKHQQMTDRECMQEMGYTDMNSVRPRITELIEADLLTEVRTIKCGVTGKMVRVVGVK